MQPLAPKGLTNSERLRKENGPHFSKLSSNLCLPTGYENFLRTPKQWQLLQEDKALGKVLLFSKPSRTEVGSVNSGPGICLSPGGLREKVVTFAIQIEQ